MFTPFRQTVHASLKIFLVLGFLLLPLAVSVAPTYALRADAAPKSQSGNQNENVVVLNEVQNPDGTTTTTVRIYVAPNDPNAPNSIKHVSQDTCDVMTHPRFRAKIFSKKGIIVQTAEAFYRANPMEFIYGFPSERHGRLKALQLAFEKHHYINSMKKETVISSPVEICY